MNRADIRYGVFKWLPAKIGCLLFKIGFRPRYSTGAHGYTTCGYGRLDTNGFFRFTVESEENRLFNKEAIILTFTTFSTTELRWQESEEQK